jgi:hypothetical protein
LALNYWPLSYVIFSLFFLLGYPKCELAKLTWVNLHFLTYFLYLNLVFFVRSFFWKFFFILVSCRKWRVGRVNLSGLDIFFSQFFMTSFLDSSFCIKLFAIELSHFFPCLNVLLFRERIDQANPGQFACSLLMFFFFIFNFGLFC